MLKFGRMVIQHIYNEPMKSNHEVFPLERLDARELASRLGGTLYGDGAARVSGIRPLETAGPGDLTFFDPAISKRPRELLQAARQTRASVLLVHERLEDLGATQIVVPHPYAAAATLASIFQPRDRPPAAVHATAILGTGIILGEDVSVGAYCVIGDDVTIGEGTIIHPHVTIYNRVRIGAKCLIHSHAVIREDSEIGDDCHLQPGIVVGGEGFGYLPNMKDGHFRIPHIGRAVLESGVDLGANATIDRATFGETRVREGAKIDNLVTVGHNSIVGRRSFLCGQVGVSGSVTIGDRVRLGGQTGVGDHVRIGDDVRSAGQSGITKDVPDRTDVSGFPARPVAQLRREHAALRRLPALMRKLRRVLGDSGSAS